MNAQPSKSSRWNHPSKTSAIRFSPDCRRWRNPRPSVTGELALGHLRGRAEILRLLGQLPRATVATTAELLGFIERHGLFGLGIGYLDAQLLAATMLTDDAPLWTRDRQLRTAAERLGAAYTAET